jgi:hypothetical protein
MIITSRGFGFEIEVAAKVAKLGVSIYEVPVSYYGRTYEQGKKVGLRDGVAAVWYIVRFNLFCSLRRSFNQMPAKLESADSRPRLQTDALIRSEVRAKK